MTENANEVVASVPAIHQAMAAILAGVKAVGKGAYNKDQKFYFRSVDQVMNELNGLMGKYGVFLLPEVTSFTRANVAYTNSYGKETARSEVDIEVRFRFVQADGSEVAATVRGEGRDQGDKATSKAHTMALKTMLLQVFMVPTSDMQDPDATSGDRDEPTEQPARQQRGQGQQRQEDSRAAKADSKADRNGKAKTDEPAANGNGSFTALDFEHGLKQLSERLGESVDETAAISALRLQWPNHADRCTRKALDKLGGGDLDTALRAIWTQLAKPVQLMGAER